MWTSELFVAKTLGFSKMMAFPHGKEGVEAVRTFSDQGEWINTRIS